MKGEIIDVSLNIRIEMGVLSNLSIDFGRDTTGDAAKKQRIVEILIDSLLGDKK